MNKTRTDYTVFTDTQLAAMIAANRAVLISDDRFFSQMDVIKAAEAQEKARAEWFRRAR